MSKLITHKILGFKDSMHSFVLTTKINTHNELVIQIVDELTLANFSNVSSAYLYYRCYKDEKENCIDLSPTINTKNSSISFLLSDVFTNKGINICEIVLKDDRNRIILTTNIFVVKVLGLGGECY